MALLAEDPNTAIRPDFSTERHQEARDHLISDTVDADQAIRILETLWNLSNNIAKEAWAERITQEARESEAALQLAAEQESLRKRTEEEEQLSALKEERKKNKSKYGPFRDVGVPSNPIVIPSHYASRKMKKGDFCELFYFMNDGIGQASISNLDIDSEALVMLPAANGQHSWIPAGAAHDPRTVVTKDEDLSWEQFNEATPRMINSMRENDWPEARVQMHIEFWSALMNHRWCHDLDKVRQRALLTYQGQQRRKWHLAVSGPHSYSLAVLNQDLLDQVKEDLLDQRRNRAALAYRQARFFLSFTCRYI
jgi:hypothetical protein